LFLLHIQFLVPLSELSPGMPLSTRTYSL